MSITDPVDPRTLIALVAVADEGSFRAAARSLGYTQSAVSHQVASLERRLGAQLFDRPGGRRRVALTPLGDLAYLHAHRILAANNELEGDVTAALAGERGTLRIGALQTLLFLLAEPLARLRRERPGIEVFLEEPDTDAMLLDKLHTGALDVGLYINVESDERVLTSPLFEDRWTILARRDDPVANTGFLTLDALDGKDIVAWHERWPAQARLEKLWRQRRIKPRVVYRTDDSLMIQVLVAAGLGCACVSAASIQQLIDPLLKRIPIQDDVPPRTVSVCYARDREPSPAALVLIDALLATPRGLPGSAAATT
jgi:DNA-binding transcriptional LysR family regulator